MHNSYRYLEERIFRADVVLDALLRRSYDLHAVVAFVTFEEVEGTLHLLFISLATKTRNAHVLSLRCYEGSAPVSE